MQAHEMLPRVALVHGPTPIVRPAKLAEMLGIDLFVKRDDATSGAESGNKVRKLELLLADALDKRANVVITCGGVQSNHARATAIACASLGLRAVLFLRVADPKAELSVTGNVLLDRLVGAELRLITHAEYADRGALMESAALELARAGERPYVIPEGGSNGLGALGYVLAMREVRAQIDMGLAGGRERFDLVVHACGSGGTAAGVALGAGHYDVATDVRAMAVCDDAAYFVRVIDRITTEARGFDPALGHVAHLVVDAGGKGPAYGVMDLEQRRFLVDVARRTGTVLDPVYTGKALFGLARAIERGDIARGKRVLFIHTGGLPGLLAQSDALRDVL